MGARPGTGERRQRTVGRDRDGGPDRGLRDSDCRLPSSDELTDEIEGPV